jgi:hypothetical protein
LQPELESIKSATTDILEQSELFAHILQGLVPFEAVVPRHLVMVAGVGNKPPEKLVGNETDKHTHRK